MPRIATDPNRPILHVPLDRELRDKLNTASKEVGTTMGLLLEAVLRRVEKSEGIVRAYKLHQIEIWSAETGGAP